MFHQSGGFSRYSAYLRSKQQRTRLFRLLTFLVLFFAAIGFLAYAGITTVRVVDEAMEPTLHPGDRLLATPYPYGIRLRPSDRRILSFREPERGDIVLVRPAYNAGLPAWLAGIDTALRILSFQLIDLEALVGEGRGDQWIVRRVVGLPGDTVYVEDGWCFVKSGGATLFRREDELVDVPYRPGIPRRPDGWSPTYPGPFSFPLTQLDQHSYFLLADNRIVLDDSRLWGPVDRAAILSKSALVYWPLNREHPPQAQ